MKNNEKYFILVSNAVQSKGPVPSGLMLEGGAHLAGRLYQEGYMPYVFDFNSLESIKTIHQYGKKEFLNQAIEQIDEKINLTGAKVVGFTLYTNGFKDNIQIAQELKKRNKGLIIVAGGPQVSIFEEEIFSHTDAFDFLIRGKGDEAISKIGDFIYKNENLSNIPNLIYKKGDSIIKNKKSNKNIKTLPFPIYDPDVYSSIDDKILVSTLRTSTGCRYAGCNFCIQPKIDGLYSERNIDDVIKEVEFLKNKFGIKYFRLSDPNPSPKQLKELFENLPRDVKISSFAYSDQEYDFSKYKKNLIGLFIGVESLNGKVLHQLNKTKNPEQYINQCKEMISAAKKEGIATVYANIVPVPNDTTKRIQEEVKKVLELQPDFITALPLAPIPNTPLYRKARNSGQESGIILEEDFIKKWMLYELDLLQSPSNWPKPPLKIKVNNKFMNNPFITTSQFVAPLAKEGINIISDEIVLMASMYYDKLSIEQNQRRKEVNDFHNKLRNSFEKPKKLKKIIERLKKNE